MTISVAQNKPKAANNKPLQPGTRKAANEMPLMEPDAPNQVQLWDHNIKYYML